MANTDFQNGVVLGSVAGGNISNIGEIPDGAVTTPKLADGAVTLEKLSSDIYSETAKAYMKMNGMGGIELPFEINADYEIECTFFSDYYFYNKSVIGNSISSGTTAPKYMHFTPFNNKWYTSDGTNEINFGTFTAGEHTVIINRNGKIYLDGTEMANYTPTTYNANIVIGYRVGNSSAYDRFIKTFKIRSISTGDLLFDLKFKQRTILGITQNVVYDNVSGNVINTSAVDYLTDTTI